MKKYTAFITCCMVIFFSAGSSFAQEGFTGPAQIPVSAGQIILGQQAVQSGWNTTVSQAVYLPHDSWVVLSGNIISMLPGGRQYMFRDSSGDIAVDIGSKEWRGLNVGVSDRVEIYGEVKISRGQIHIKVHAIKLAGV